MLAAPASWVALASTPVLQSAGHVRPLADKPACRCAFTGQRAVAPGQARVSAPIRCAGTLCYVRDTRRSADHGGRRRQQPCRITACRITPARC
ncbi:hypothetical protein RSPO_c00354 [Ralstonia solanacearum Po82]|uniref:Uncharacterized protein n=1 Tax=Ralstonia solanacearum (strain Po82) TaxID=1031711 RepID=F6G6W2_RALS8|nr:hypothetical protein RSPO_c00354 [Ralstonia solanacearum Po82]